MGHSLVLTDIRRRILLAYYIFPRTSRKCDFFSISLIGTLPHTFSRLYKFHDIYNSFDFLYHNTMML